MNRQDAIKLMKDHLKSPNLQKHSLAVGFAMGALAQKLGGDPDTWEIAGIVHDADYEEVKDDLTQHSHKTVEWLKTHEANQEIIDAVYAHAWGFVPGNPEPKTHMQWALYCSDELTGFIVAVALVRPEKTLSGVTVDAILKKWPQKAFAKGVHRQQIELCKDKLGLPLEAFIDIVLSAMQNHHMELGL